MFTTIGNNDVITTICGNTITNFDNSTNSFITAANITNFNQQYIIDTLVRGLKIYGLWDKMYAVYPFIGGTANTHKFNLKDPRDTDDAYRITFAGTITHNASGVTPSVVNGQADTYINLSALTNWTTDSHLSVYSPTTDATASWNIGSRTFNAATVFGLGLRTTPVYDNGTATNRASGTGGGNGYWLGSTTGTNLRRIYRNGNIISSNVTTNSSPPPNLSLWLFRPNSPQLIAIMPNTLRLVTVGKSLNDSEVLRLSILVQQYQSSLGRAV